jgi:hypothetical protein
MVKIIITIIALSIAVISNAATYYVAPADSGGNDSAAGTISAPWATFNKALSTAQAGDTVYFRGGVYHSLGAVAVANSGTASNPICFFNYPGEKPIMDCQLHCANLAGTYNSAIFINTKQYIHFRGITVRNVFMCYSDRLNGAIHSISSANLRFENMTVHNIGQKAFWINSGAWNSWDGANAPFTYDSTFFINCDVFDVCDSLVSAPGNGGDAWKTVAYQGNYYHFEGNRMWNYSDDGIDPSRGYVLFKNNWMMSSAKYNNFPATEGNGFKMGALSTSQHYLDSLVNPDDTIFVKVINNIALFCVGAGYLNNLYLGGGGHTPNNGYYYNNISYRNLKGYVDAGRRWGDGFGDRDDCTSRYRNNISFVPDGQQDAIGRPLVMELFAAWHDVSNSNWIAANLGSIPRWDYSTVYTFSDADLVTSDSLEIVARFTAPRQADGSLPYPPPLELKSDSPLKGAGTYVGMSDNPDIGWDADYYYGTMSVDSTATDILAFTLPQQTAPGTINTGNHTVAIQVAHGTNVTSLTPTISLSYGATIAPTSGTVRNFTTPQIYTVTALNGIDEQEWTVTVTVASAPPSPAEGRRWVRTASGYFSKSINGTPLYYKD